jgi:hypothetical protein
MQIHRLSSIYFGRKSLSALYFECSLTIEKNAFLSVCPGLSPTRPANDFIKAPEEIPVAGIAAMTSWTEIGPKPGDWARVGSAVTLPKVVSKYVCKEDI